MADRIRNIAALSLAALAGWLVLACTAVAASGVLAPLPRSDYTVHALCSAPDPGHAGCLSLQLRPLTAAARAHTHPLGFTRPAPRAGPRQRRRVRPDAPGPAQSAYQLPERHHEHADDRDRRRLQRPHRRSRPQSLQRGIWPSGMHQSERLLQPGQPERQRRRRQPAVPENGRRTRKSAGWHTDRKRTRRSRNRLGSSRSRSTSRPRTRSARTARSCSSRPTPRATGTSKRPSRPLATWAPPRSPTRGAAPSQARASDWRVSSPFNHPGIVITASAGDNGYLNWDAENPEEAGYAEFPASSPHVVAVGGTRLELDDGRRMGIGDGVERQRRGRRRLQRNLPRPVLAAQSLELVLGGLRRTAPSPT